MHVPYFPKNTFLINRRLNQHNFAELPVILRVIVPGTDNICNHRQSNTISTLLLNTGDASTSCIEYDTEQENQCGSSRRGRQFKSFTALLKTVFQWWHVTCDRIYGFVCQLRCST